MSESDGASNLTSTYESSVMETTSEVLEHPEASESPSSAEQLSAEDKHDSDEPIVLKEIPDVRKELPDLDVAPESEKEQVVDEREEEVDVPKEVPDSAQVLMPVKEFSLDSSESEESDVPTTKKDDVPRDTIVQKELPDLNVDEKDEQKKMLKEMPDLAQVLKLVEESILDSAESGESDVPTAEPNDEPRDSDELIVPKELPDLDVTPESDGEQVIDEQNGLVEVPDLDEVPELVQNLDSPTRSKSYSQFENSASESVFSVKKQRNHGAFNWWTMFPVHWKIETPYWSSILLLLLWSEFSNATNFRGQTSGLNLHASHHVYDVGSSARLFCIGSNSVQWWLNGSVSDMSDIDAEEDNRNEIFAVLTINNISIQLNNTYLQCYNGVTESNKVTLQIRGPPSPPTSLTYDRINHTVSWSAGYSLWSNATYCLEIYVLPSSDVLYSICNWNKTYFSVELWSHLLVCEKILVQISAENSAGNSTSETIMIASAENNITDIVVQAEANTTDKAVYFSFTRAICIERTELLADGVPMIPSMVEGQGNVISVTLPDNKIYDSLSVHDTGSGFTALAERIVTYDVLNIEVEPSPNMLNIGATFLSNTSALGVFYVVVYHNELEGLDFERSYYFPVKREIAEQVSFSLDVPPGEYLIFAYDIEWDNEIQRSGLPADAKYVTVNQSTGGSEVNSSDRCSIDSSELIANVMCFCEVGHYQVILLEHNLRTITSKRQECSKSASFVFERGKSYTIAAFYEDGSDCVFGKSPFFSKSGVLESQFDDPDTTHVHTTEEEESNSSKIIGITVFLVICTIVAAVIIVFLIILVKNNKKKKKYNLNDSHV